MVGPVVSHESRTQSPGWIQTRPRHVSPVATAREWRPVNRWLNPVLHSVTALAMHSVTAHALHSVTANALSCWLVVMMHASLLLWGLQTTFWCFEGLTCVSGFKFPGSKIKGQTENTSWDSTELHCIMLDDSDNNDSTNNNLIISPSQGFFWKANYQPWGSNSLCHRRLCLWPTEVKVLQRSMFYGHLCPTEVHILQRSMCYRGPSPTEVCVL